jgi:hypothetical protein
MSKLETNTIDNISGSSTLTIGDTNTSTIALKSGATLTNFPDNTPAFDATKSGDQTLSNATDTKITFETEVIDTDSAFSSSRFTVPSGKGGKYFVYAAVGFATNGTNLRQVYLIKNGSEFRRLSNLQGGSGSGVNTYNSAGVIVSLADGDYVEIYAYQNSGGSLDALSSICYFGGYKIIE